MIDISPIEKYAVAGIADILSCFGIPTVTAAQIYQDVLDKRNIEALDILFLELRQGHFENVDKHEAVSILARYQRDAMEGVAKNNLRLMASVINGMAKSNELHANSFLKYAPILATLTEDEVRVLAIMAQLSPQEIAYSMGHHMFVKQGIKNYNEILQSLLRTALVRAEVKSFEDKDDKEQIHSVMRFDLTNLAKEILKYVDFIIQKEAK